MTSAAITSESQAIMARAGTPNNTRRVWLLALMLGGTPPLLRAQERVDSVVESSRSTLRLGDKTIRVLLGRTSTGAAPVRDLAGGVLWNGRRYRGSIEIVNDASGAAIINRVDLEIHP